MLKTIVIILIFIAFVIFIAITFSLFFSPQELLRFEECVLLKNPKTNEVDCFGCINDLCKDAPADWVYYEKPTVGIPYACFESEQGCQLAQ